MENCYENKCSCGRTFYGEKLQPFCASCYDTKLKFLQAIIDKTNAQEHVGFIKQDLTPFIYYKDSLNLKPDDLLYAAPIPAQQSKGHANADQACDKYIESMGGSDSDAWHDAPVDGVFKDGFKLGLAAAQQSPVVAVPNQNWPDKLVEFVTKAILFEDDGSTDQWEENINLGQAALKAIPNDWQLVPKFVTKEMRIGAWASAAEIRPNIKSMLDTMWADLLKHSPMYGDNPSPRITEQDAREFALAFIEYWIADMEDGRLESFDNFMRDEGRTLLNKLNAKPESGGKS